MNDTGYDNATAILKHRASGYTRRLGIVLTNCDYVDMSIPHAAGALYSTTLDLLKWDQALYTEKLVPRKSIEAMFTPFKSNYGYGWLIDRKFGLKRYEHGGGIMGFVTIIERFPEEKLLVVALSNLENSPIGQIGTDLAAIALGRRYVVPREPKVAKLDPALYDAYVGRYEADIPARARRSSRSPATVPGCSFRPRVRPSSCSRPNPRPCSTSRPAIPRPGSSRTAPARSRVWC